MRQNLFWAFVYNVIGIPVAAGVLYPAFGLLLTPAMARGRHGVQLGERGHQQPAAPPASRREDPAMNGRRMSGRRPVRLWRPAPGDGTHAVAVDPEIKRAS